MERALAFVDERYETAVLTAGAGELYQRFGFRVVPEHRFVGETPAPPAADAPAWRRLDLDAPEDLALLHRRLHDRAPVSRALGVGREWDVFLFDSVAATLHYAEDLDAIVWAWMRDDALVLTDLLAARIPTLDEVLAGCPGAPREVEVHFHPERLDATLRAEPWHYDGEEILMARGPFLASGTPICLPRGARC